jgi:hypothetical protein
MPDQVNHPKHYTFGTIEVIDVIEDWDLGFCLGNTVKYIARSPHKGTELQDLKKAAWYLQRQISRLEQRNPRRRKGTSKCNPTSTSSNTS